MALGAMFLRATSLSTTARLSNAEEPDSLRKISFCRVLPLWLHHDTLIHCRCIIKDFVHHKVSWTFNSLLRMHTNKHGACIQTSMAHAYKQAFLSPAFLSQIRAGGTKLVRKCFPGVVVCQCGCVGIEARCGLVEHRHHFALNGCNRRLGPLQ
jgi:hypothetical protein